MLAKHISFGSFKQTELESKLQNRLEGSPGVLMTSAIIPEHFIIVDKIIKANNDSLEVEGYQTCSTNKLGVLNKVKQILNFQNWNVHSALNATITYMKQNTPPDAVDFLFHYMSDFMPGNAGRFKREEPVQIGPEGSKPFDLSKLDQYM